MSSLENKEADEYISDDENILQQLNTQLTNLTKLSKLDKVDKIDKVDKSKNIE